MLGIIAGVAGTLIKASSARKAAKAQERAARDAAAAQVEATEKQIESNERLFNLSREDLAPARESYAPYNDLMNYYMGITSNMGYQPGSGVRPEITEVVETTQVNQGGQTEFIEDRSRGGFNLGGIFTLLNESQAEPRNETVTRYKVGDRTFDTREDAEAYADSQTTDRQEMLGYRQGAEKLNRTAEEEWEEWSRNPIFEARFEDNSQYEGDFQASPGYQFAVDENLRGIEGSAAARGGLYSGATMQALGQRANDLANQEFRTWQGRQDALRQLWQNRQDRERSAWTAREDQDRINYLNMLTGGLVRGQNAAAQSATVNQNNAQLNATAYANMGDAQAAGIIGAGNARAAGAIGFGNAINSGIQNALGAWNQMNTAGNFNTTATTGLGGIQQAGGASNFSTNNAGWRPFQNPLYGLS